MKTLQWMLTERCNYQCRHCYLHGSHPSDSTEKAVAHPDTQTLLSCMDHMRQEGIRDVILTGGEPLLRKDLWMIMRALTERGIRISRIITNASLLTAAHLEMLRVLGQEPVFNISFDGAGGMHGYLRRHPQAEESVQKAFTMCREYGFETAADMTLFRGNLPYLRESIRTLEELGCFFPAGADSHVLHGDRRRTAFNRPHRLAGGFLHLSDRFPRRAYAGTGRYCCQAYVHKKASGRCA